MSILIFTYILLAVSGIAHATQDIIRNRYAFSIFSRIKNPKLIQWIDPAVSWKNKWKKGDPGQGTRFFLSSTLFVWITDLWHFSQMIRSISLIASLVLWVSPSLIAGINLDIPLWATYVLDIAILKTASGIAFTIFYDYIFTSKKPSMSYSIWKFIAKLGLDFGKNTGIVVAFIYLALLAGVSYITYLIAPGPPQWKFPGTIPVWEWIMLVGFGLWIVWMGWMLLAGASKMDARHKAEVGRKT